MFQPWHDEYCANLIYVPNDSVTVFSGPPPGTELMLEHSFTEIPRHFGAAGDHEATAGGG